MPQPRKYKTNAERQAAYRRRKARREPDLGNSAGAGTHATPGQQALVDRLLANDRAARAREA